MAATAKEPIAVATWAKSSHHCFWSQRQVAEGRQGPLQYELTKRQVTLGGDRVPARTVWLVMKRTMGEHPSSWYYSSNAPLSARLPLLVWLSGLRWAIEQCFEETKTKLGMDQYEVRKYPGWHHHLLLPMFAHFCLGHLQIRLGKKSTSYDGITASEPASGGLARQNLDDCGRPPTGSRDPTA